MLCPECGFVDGHVLSCERFGTDFAARSSARVWASQEAGGGAAGGAEPLAEPRVAQGDRRMVTVLFADLSGYTRIAEQSDPEVAAAILREALGQLMEEAESRDGWIEKNIGDAILAVFGAPRVHEDDALRAVQTALAMQARMVSINEHLRHQLPHELELHIGLNTGLVVMAPRTEYRDQVGHADEFMVVGDVVNVGARLQQAAGPGRIVVGGATYALTRAAFQYRPLAPLRLKGKRGKILAYECVASGAAGPLGRRPRSRSPLVGRQRELTAVTNCLDQLAAGSGGLVSVIGEPGVGKSRLVEELATAAQARKLEWLHAQAASFGGRAYDPFVYMIKAHAGILESDGEPEKRQKLESALWALFPDSATELMQPMAALLRVHGQDGQGELGPTTSDGAVWPIFLAVRRFFERLAQQHPVALVFEDVHWMDPSSTALLEHVMPLVESASLLVIGVSRPERNAPVARLQRLAGETYAERYLEVRLSALNPADSAELVQNLLPLEERPLQQLIMERTGGNPFFVEEVVHSLIETRAVARDPLTGRWRAAVPVERISIPDTLRGVILARIDRLEDRMRKVLRLAAVVGRRFSHHTLEAIDHPDGNVDQQSIMGLEELELIVSARQSPNGEYAFKHALIQEVAYESILLETRRALHRRVATSIENLSQDRTEEVNGVLAYHYARAEDWSKAQAYLGKAGDEASKIAADEEALTRYKETLEACARAFGDDWNPVDKATLERKMGEALFRLGDHDGATSYLKRALDTLASPYPTTSSAVGLGICSQILQQARFRLRSSKLDDAATSTADAGLEQRVRVYQAMSWIDYREDHRRFILDALCELNASEQVQFPPGIVHGSAALGMILDFLGGYVGLPVLGVADWYHRRAVAVAESSHDDASIGFAHLSAGYYAHNCLSEWDSALVHYARSADAFWRVGVLREWGGVSWLIAWILRLKGNFDQSMDQCARMIRVGEDANDRQVWGWGLEGVGHNLLFAGRLAEAQPYLERAVELLDGVPDFQSSACARTVLGQCYVRDGRVGDGIALLEETAALIAKHNVRDFLCVYALAEAYLIEAEEDAEAGRAVALKKARVACRAALKQRRYSREGYAGACRYQGTYEWLLGNEKKARGWWSESLQFAERVGARFDLGLTNLEIGRLTGDADNVRRAESIFAEIGALHELHRARALL